MQVIKGEAIKQLIAQREPAIMVDTLYGATDTEADTGLSVTGGLYFCCGGILCEPGLVEHIAQSASAFAGYKARLAHQPAPTGILGEVRKCRFHFLPRTGDVLRTHIRVLSEAMDVTLLEAETKVNGETAVQCQMKIVAKPA
jgi:hypothetical protein